MEQISLLGENICVEQKAKKFEIILQELQKDINDKDLTIKKLKEENEKLKSTEQKSIDHIDANYLHKYYEEANKANYLQAELEKAISLFDDNYTLNDISLTMFYLKHKDIKFEFTSKEAEESFKKLYYRLAYLYREEFEINEKHECDLFPYHARKIFDETEIVEI